MMRRLQTARRSGIAAAHFDVEMLDPYHTRGKRPIARRIESNCRLAVGDHEPALLDRVIRPERDVGLIRNQTVGRRERLEILERANLRQEGRRRRALHAGAHQALDFALQRAGGRGQVAPEWIAGARVGGNTHDVAVGAQEGRRPFAILFAEGPDALVGVVAEDISAGEFGEVGAAIDETAADRFAGEVAGAVVRVFVDGVDKFGVGGFAVEARAVVRAFVKAPAVVAALYDDVDFLPEVLANFSAEEAAGGRVEIKAPGVAQSRGVHFGADLVGINGLAEIFLDANQRVVVGDFVGAGIYGVGIIGGILRAGIGGETFGLVVDIEAKNGGEETFVDEARVVEGVVARAAVADGGVEIAVVAEAHAAAVVVIRGVEGGEEDLFAGGVGDVGIVFGNGESGDAVEVDITIVFTHAAGVVGNVKIAVLGIVGMEGEAQDAHFGGGLEHLAAGAQEGGDVEEDGFFGAAVFAIDIGDDLDLAGFFDDKETVFFARHGDDIQRLGEHEAGAAVDGEGVDGGVSGGDGEFGGKVEGFEGLACGGGGCGCAAALGE